MLYIMLAIVFFIQHRRTLEVHGLVLELACCYFQREPKRFLQQLDYKNQMSFNSAQQSPCFTRTVITVARAAFVAA